MKRPEDMMNTAEYRAGVESTWRGTPTLTHDDVWYAALAINGEAGELAECVKKLSRDGGGVLSPMRKLDMVKEAGDVLYYLDRFLRAIGSDLDEAMRVNLAKLQDRQERGKIQGEGDAR